MRKEYIGTAEITVDDDISSDAVRNIYDFLAQRERSSIQVLRLQRNGTEINMSYTVRKELTIPEGIEPWRAADLVRCDAALDREEILAFKPIKDGKYRLILYKCRPDLPEDHQDIYTVADWSASRGLSNVVDFFYIDEAEQAF